MSDGMRDLICAYCGSPFRGRKRAKYCSKRCGRYDKPPCSVDGCANPKTARGLCVTHYTREKYPDRQHGQQSYKLVEMPCAMCGELMLKQVRSDRANQFCSFKCRGDFQRANRPRQRGNRLRMTPPRRFVSGPCAWCGTVFTVAQKLARYCSAKCSARASESRRGDGFSVSWAVRLSIYERDGWVCQLCREQVDPDLPYTDSWSATLDHIECQSWALVPDHSPSNLRLAHRWCNSVRGDERFYTTEVLIA